MSEWNKRNDFINQIPNFLEQSTREEIRQDTEHERRKSQTTIRRAGNQEKKQYRYVEPVRKSIYREEIEIPISRKKTEYSNYHYYKNPQVTTYKRCKRRKRKRKLYIYKIVLGVLLILGITGGWVTAKVKMQINTIFDNLNRNSQEDLSAVAVEQEDLVYDKDVINILLVGSDKRAEWTETGRSDSTMIATLDKKNKAIKLTSLMRDMYVTIPGYGQNRFNSAYSFGGVSLLYKTIASNFEIKLDGYVIVDFDAFKKVINMIGGVDITLTDKEYEYLTTAYKKGSVLDLVPGKNKMNGTQALAYTRIRQDAQGDFGRTQRQRIVLQAIFQQAKAMSLNKILQLTKEIMKYISTDLQDEEILLYLRTLIMMGTTEINQMRIPVDNSYTQDRIDGMAVLIPDLDENKKQLRQFIFE